MKTCLKSLVSAIICVLLTVAAIGLTGCDVSAHSDLRKAEKAIKHADDLNADRWAEKEYRLAQQNFTEAMDLARERKINDARTKAALAIDWAEEASLWAKIRSEEMQKEKDRLGTYKD